MSPLKRLVKTAHSVQDFDHEQVDRTPHLHRRLLILAVLAFLLSAFIGTHLLQNTAANAEVALSAAGAHRMTATELITSAERASSAVTPYWFGEIADFSYTGKSVESDEFVIAYASGDKNQPDSVQDTYKIDTYLNQEAFLGDQQGQDFSVDHAITTPAGRGILYNFGTMKLAEVTIPDTSQLILMHFAQPQSLEQLIAFADSLTPLA
jgi:hypothetical protein